MFKFLLSILLGIYPEAELLDHMVTLCLLFKGSPILFSTVAVPFYILNNNAQRVPISPLPHQHLLIFTVLIIAILVNIYSFLEQNFLSTYYMPGIVLDTRDIIVK